LEKKWKKIEKKKIDGRNGKKQGKKEHTLLK